MWMVLVDVSGYVDGAGGVSACLYGADECQWVCGWCWWMSVGVWMVLVSVSGCGGVGGHQW